jgi:hypothetical protein
LAARRIGEGADIAPLAEGEFDLNWADPWELAMIAAGISGQVGLYRRPHPTGALYFTVEDVELPPLDAVELAGIVAQTIGALHVDSAVALERVLRDEGYDVRATAQPRRVDRDGMMITVRFDDLGRVASLTAGPTS